jgi:hypothetical protein
MTVNKELTFERKRQIAKRLVAGDTPKKICFEEGIHRQTLYDIRRQYTRIVLVEVYPSGVQCELDFVNGHKTYKDGLYLRPDRKTGKTRKGV